MHHPNFCAECGAQLRRKGWRVSQSRNFCEDCARRLGKNGVLRPLVTIAAIAISSRPNGGCPAATPFTRTSAYATPSRHSRRREPKPSADHIQTPPPPPLIIERASNSPLSDLPVNVNEPARKSNHEDNSTKDPSRGAQSTDDTVYICGARTKKGTPCRRRVHFAGERCFQHKGMPAMLPVDKLIIKGAG